MSHEFCLQAGAAALILQASLLSTAVVVYWTGSLSQQTQLLFFLGLIVSLSTITLLLLILRSISDYTCYFTFMWISIAAWLLLYYGWN